MVHMGPTRAGGPTRSRPSDLALVLDRFPGLQIIAAHLGGLHQWEETLAHLAGRDIYMDTSCCHEVIPAQTLGAILKLHDPERILFGSDYPLFAPQSERTALTKLLDRLGASSERVLKNGARLAMSLQTGGFPDLPPSPEH